MYIQIMDVYNILYKRKQKTPVKGVFCYVSRVTLYILFHVSHET